MCFIRINYQYTEILLNLYLGIRRLFWKHVIEIESLFPAVLGVWNMDLKMQQKQNIIFRG